MAAQTQEDLLAFYQSMTADTFADRMLERELVAKHFSRELLGACWVRGVTAAQESNEELWQQIVAYLFASGIVEGMLWGLESIRSLQK